MDRPDDLGPVRISIRLTSKPRIGSLPPVPDDGFAPVGLLADLVTLHRRGWEGQWTLALGPHTLPLDLSAESGHLEELWVFLLELVDTGGGEWTLSDGDEFVTLDAQVYGPDVIVDFATPDASGAFGGTVLPRKATLRLRAVVSAGTAFFRAFLKEALRMDKGMKDRPDLLAFYEDLDQLESTVAELPGTFKGQAKQ